MRVIRADDPIEESRLSRLAAEADEDAAAMERVGRVFSRLARIERIRAARIRADLHAAILGHPGAGPVG